MDTAGSDSEELQPGLYIVATPIGNLNDISFRAVNILKSAALIAAEDTRVTGKLLRHIGADTPMMRHDEHSAPRARPELLRRAAAEPVALVTDAGTPLISDPGYRLVREARAAGIPVTTAPGPCAAVAALSIAGLPTDRFLFAGFPPPKEKGLRDTLRELAPVRSTLIFYETGPRLTRFLAVAADVLGAREAAVARELTKLYEEVRSGPLAELAADYAGAPPPKGELVVVIGPPAAEEAPGEEELDHALRAALAAGSLKDAVRRVTDSLGLPRAAVYARALELKDR